MEVIQKRLSHLAPNKKIEKITNEKNSNFIKDTALLKESTQKNISEQPLPLPTRQIGLFGRINISTKHKNKNREIVDQLLLIKTVMIETTINSSLPDINMLRDMITYLQEKKLKKYKIKN